MFGKCRGCGIHIHNDIGYCNTCVKRLGRLVPESMEDYSDYFDETRPDAAKFEFADLEQHEVLFRINDLEDDISELKSIDGKSYEEEMCEYSIRLEGIHLKKIGVSALIDKIRSIT